jgi:hypothetical protein
VGVQAEQVGQHRGWDLGGQLQQGGVAGGPGGDAEGGQTGDQVLGVQWRSGWRPVNSHAWLDGATAWHWLDPRTRVAKAVRALPPGGALATISTHHVAGGTERYLTELQVAYRRVR